jgi:hypothetical protein
LGLHRETRRQRQGWCIRHGVQQLVERARDLVWQGRKCGVQLLRIDKLPHA